MLILEQQILDYHAININTRYPNWNIAITYHFGDIIFYGHYYYKSITDNNLGFIPPDNNSQWLRWDVSNRYAAIDLQAGTTTVCDVNTKVGGTAPYDLIMELDTNRYDSIAFGEIHGSSITIETFKAPDYTTPFQTITQDISAVRQCVNSWWRYYFCPLASELDTTTKGLYFRMTPIVGRVRITITEGSQNKSSVAYMVAGQTKYVGDTLMGVGLGLTDYSHKEFDDFGVLELTRRESRQNMDIDVIYNSTRVNEVNRIARDALGKVVLFIGDESIDSGYSHLLILGLIADFNTVLDNGVKCSASFSIEEVI